MSRTVLATSPTAKADTAVRFRCNHQLVAAIGKNGAPKLTLIKFLLTSLDRLWWVC